MRFCPQCTQQLVTREEGGRPRLACPDTSCGFVHFGNFSIGCAGVVLRDGKALLVQRGWEPFAGSWQIPGGYAEHDEPLTEAVEREVQEEAGISARARDVIAFRHSIGGSIGGPSTNIYVIFRLDYVSGEPTYDDDEVTGAGFFSLDQIAQIDSMQGLSRWAIEQALEAGDHTGLAPSSNALSAGRPGSQLFGPSEVA